MLASAQMDVDTPRSDTANNHWLEPFLDSPYESEDDSDRRSNRSSSAHENELDTPWFSKEEASPSDFRPLNRKSHQGEPVAPETYESAVLVTASGEDLYDFLNRVTSQPIMTAAVKLNWSLDDAINAALLYSHQIQGLRIATLESYQDIGVAFGEFDTVSFFEQNFRDSNAPVGNSNESDGSVARIKGEEFDFQYGIRQQLLSGGEIEISKQFGTRDDNSGILTPRDQASDGLNLRLSKELLKGSGRSIGMNEVLVAIQQAEVDKYENVAEMTALLTEISEAWWTIFSARGALIAAIDNAQQAKMVLDDLMARRDIDATPNLLEQARIAFQQQYAQADMAHQELATAQFNLIRLVNAPELLANHQRIEIIPSPIDFDQHIAPDLDSRQTTAIHNRPEVRSVVESIREAQLIYNFSINDLLPRLTFNAGAEFAGLSGNRDLKAASANKFDSNATYQLGFNFEFSLQNRQARFQKRRAELALARLSSQWAAAIEMVKSDVLSAAQNLSTSQSLIDRQANIFGSANERLVFLEQRRYHIPREGAIPSLQLGQLLDVQSQLADAKSQYADALASREMAKFELNRASGILVQAGCAGLENPGTHNCLTIFTQHIKTDRVYRSQAVQTAKRLIAVSEKHTPPTWDRSLLHAKKCTKGNCFGNPGSTSPCDCQTVPVEVQESLPAMEAQPAVQEEISVFDEPSLIPGGYFSSAAHRAPQSSLAHSQLAATARVGVTNYPLYTQQAQPRVPSSPQHIAKFHSQQATPQQLASPAAQMAMKKRLNHNNVAQSNVNSPRRDIAQVGYWQEAPTPKALPTLRNQQASRQLKSLSQTRKPAQAQGRPRQSGFGWPSQQ